MLSMKLRLVKLSLRQTTFAPEFACLGKLATAEEIGGPKTEC
jgi:hypothetical protein